jgi:hypothetical protein
MHRTAEFATTAGWTVPVLIALIYILVNSLIKEPNRRSWNAIMIAGAGAAYLSGGGFGLWELAFCGVMAACAFLGLGSYRFIGIGWLLHTAWDMLHQLYGNPLLPFELTSSLGCAICDPIVAVWFLAGAPSLFDVVLRRGNRQSYI